MALPRILTFNFHEPYLCLMAKTGLHFDIGIYNEPPLARDWQTHFRPVPGNLRFVPEADWEERVQSGYYDVIIAQNEMNAIHLCKSPSPKLIVFHNRRQFMETTATAAAGDDPLGKYHQLLEIIGELFTPVFISKTKQDSYGMPGWVIPPGIDLTEYHGYRGDEARVLRVGNVMRERNLMFDVDFQEQACGEYPNTLLGVNPSIAHSRQSRTFGDYRETLRSHRCMLHVTREAYEDGYNLALLEAMATGMPAVSLSNPTSPIVDGVNGFASYDAAELYARIGELLADRDLAQRLGAQARETVREKFPMARFAEQWREAIFTAADNRTRHSAGQPRAHRHGRKVLLHYLTNPLTTGRYVEAALREEHEVVTTGCRIPEDLLKEWGFEEPIPAYAPQDIDVGFRGTYAELSQRLPVNGRPDCYVYVDSGDNWIAEDISALGMPTAAWMIDTHVNAESRLEMSRPFDHVFLAHKAQVQLFKDSGLRHVEWLPLGCVPELHAVPAPGRELDVAFVGSFNPYEVSRRGALLTGVRERFPNSFIGRAWPADMANIYARAKIVVNACYNNDVNMRVFEALASGALLITDQAEGLEDLFVDGKHLIIYRKDEDLPGLIERYLADEETRERIAAEGQREVLARHTYKHRVEKLLACFEDGEGAMNKPVLEHEVKHDTYYGHVRRELFPFVPMKTRRLLDIGCGMGAVGSTLKRERGLDFVAGVEIVEEAYRRAKTVLDEAHLANIEEVELPFEPNSFDCIICADVLEHLVEPEQALRKLGNLLREEGVIVISLPNGRYHDVLSMLSQGYWSYVPEGIMDSTHLRWFTRRNIPAFVAAAGLELLHYQPLSILDEDRLRVSPEGELRMGKLTLTGVTEQDYEEVRTYQHLVVVGRPGVDRLANARYALEANQNEAAYAHAADALGANQTERYLIMARALARLGRLAEAESLYRGGMDFDACPDAAAEYGILLVAMGKTAEARSYLEHAVAALPEHYRARGALGLLALQAGQPDVAFPLLREAADSSFAHDSLIAPLTAAADGAGRLEDALPIIERYCEFYPANPALGCVLAATLIALDRLAEARDRLETILMFHPDHEEARALLDGLLNAGSGDA